MKTKTLKTKLALNKKTIANVRGGIAQGGKIIKETIILTPVTFEYTICYSQRSCLNTCGDSCPRVMSDCCATYDCVYDV
ncbi:MAG: hypothetical protein GY765_22860 [bacterium]|nr:hypothetical protein [bacterium]